MMLVSQDCSRSMEPLTEGAPYSLMVEFNALPHHCSTLSESETQSMNSMDGSQRYLGCFDVPHIPNDAERIGVGVLTKEFKLYFIKNICLKPSMIMLLGVRQEEEETLFNFVAQFTNKIKTCKKSIHHS
ncbi:hypothetical protein C4D60_Mb05t20430 [Musa balbisiana]|uniref:Uncharacterized protein n=1 Tax=Musa balbisiana TaxID=52838 RepID=A0A4S8JXL6_MUSBA|nr:hypothetical protein C4D60_Mb05t20430 [Musa balbisiana]